LIPFILTNALHQLRGTAPEQPLFRGEGQFRKRAMVLADTLIAQHAQSEERLRQLWLTVYNRPITNEEHDYAMKFLTDLSPLV
jgi:hypothetical protein